MVKDEKDNEEKKDERKSMLGSDFKPKDSEVKNIYGFDDHII